MRKIDRLRKEARQAASFRKHTLTPFQPGKYRKNIASSYCKECGMIVVINTEPSHNEIDISGSAVAMNCTTKK